MQIIVIKLNYNFMLQQQPVIKRLQLKCSLRATLAFSFQPLKAHYEWKKKSCLFLSEEPLTNGESVFVDEVHFCFIFWLKSLV